MCAPSNSSTTTPLLFVIFTTMAILNMCGTKMGTEGLPLVHRQERGTQHDEDILAGADFLSVFMESSRRQAFRETTTPEEPSMVPYSTPQPTTTNGLDWSTDFVEDSSTDPYIRTSRSLVEDHNYLELSAQSPQDNSNLNNPSDSLSDGVILAVRVSSSVGRTLINKPLSTTTTISPAAYPDQDLVASEDHPSIVAQASKSELSVEEPEPITRTTDLETSEYSRTYPGNIHALPLQNPNFRFQDKPYHQTVIYHSNPREPGHARSVSYSTVIQAIPNQEQEKPTRHERHYDSSQKTPGQNSLEQPTRRNSSHPYQLKASMAATSNYFVTSKPLEKPTTERNWEEPPKTYGQPEQNYEVDEAVSVVSNGRTHGIQPLNLNTEKPPKTTKKEEDDNQKVGYVVEGRNYRKYRVEERTPDGFIVGEYGVVSHDDGSLRGVRYTADGTISPRLIYDALMKFLSL